MSIDTIATLRNDYTENGLRQSDLPDNPFDLFMEWFDQALGSGVAEPNGMVIATSGDDDQPSQRTVLMKFSIMADSVSSPTTIAVRPGSWRKTHVSAASFPGLHCTGRSLSRAR